jgi:hypothetical protein
MGGGRVIALSRPPLLSQPPLGRRPASVSKITKLLLKRGDPLAPNALVFSRFPRTPGLRKEPVERATGGLAYGHVEVSGSTQKSQ